MKLIKIAGLAAFAAVAALAVANVGTAFAEGPDSTICTMNENPCEEANRLSEPSTVVAASEGKVVLEGVFSTKFECNSEMKGEITENNVHGSTTTEKQVIGKIKEAFFTNCTGGCTWTAKNLPWLVHITTGTPPNGLMYTGSGGTGTPGATASGSNCVANGCTYKVTEKQPKPQTTENEPGNWGISRFEGGAPAKAKNGPSTSQEFIKLESTFLCGSEGHWKGTYVFSAPNSGTAYASFV